MPETVSLIWLSHVVRPRWQDGGLLMELSQYRKLGDGFKTSVRKLLDLLMAKTRQMS